MSSRHRATEAVPKRREASIYELRPAAGRMPMPSRDRGAPVARAASLAELLHCLWIRSDRLDDRPASSRRAASEVHSFGGRREARALQVRGGTPSKTFWRWSTSSSGGRRSWASSAAPRQVSRSVVRVCRRRLLGTTSDTTKQKTTKNNPPFFQRWSRWRPGVNAAPHFLVTDGALGRRRPLPRRAAGVEATRREDVQSHSRPSCAAPKES